MGILNLTPDSFHDGGAWNDTGRAVAQAERMLREGADVLDLGAQSTRPGAVQVGADEEWTRLAPVLSNLRTAHPDALLSIDTFHASVARRALDAGADLINDVSGGDADPDMWNVVADARAPYVMMHMQGSPETMQANPTYNDVVSDVYQNLQTKLFRAYDAGVTDVIVDVGFGFGKTTDHNWQIIQNLEQLHSLNLPILIGISRKRFIGNTIGVDDPAQRGVASAIVNSFAVLKGVNIIRTHDVKWTLQAIQLAQAFNNKELAL